MNSSTSPNIIKTAIDKLFFEEFNFMNRPDVGSVADPLIFNQLSSDRGAESVEEFKGSGEWEAKGETQNSPAGESRSGNPFIYTHTTFAKSEDIPKEFFDDDLHNAVNKLVRKMAMNGRVKREVEGMSVFRNAFAGVTYGDGATLVSATHTLMNGETQDNLLTDALSTISLADAIVRIQEMKDQDGVINGIMPRVLLVPTRLFKEATEVVDSELVPDSADNAVNYVSKKYPGLVIKQSPYIGAAQGGSDTAWFLLGEMHGLERYTRESIATTLVPWQQARNDNFIYKGRYRESTGATSHLGVFGSTGLT